MELTLKYFSPENFIVTSFLDEVILKVRENFPDMKTGLLLGKSKGGFFSRLSEIFFYKRFSKCKADFIAPHHYFLKTGILKKASRRNIPAIVWTVDKSAMLKHLMNEHCVTAIITDNPEKALEIRDSM